MVIVERKRLERAGELLKEIVDFIPSVIIGIDSARRIIQWNMQAEKLIEIGFDQVLGMRLKEVVPEFEASFKYIDEAIAECSTMHINNFLILSDGEYKYYNKYDNKRNDIFETYHLLFNSESSGYLWTFFLTYKSIGTFV